MQQCPNCGRFYGDVSRFCSVDGARLEESAPAKEEPQGGRGARTIPAPADPLRMRLTIIDHDDEGRRSRVIHGLALDVAEQGMRIQTGTVETGQLNIIRDHTVAFKNKLEMEVDLPSGTVSLSGFAAWYKPASDGINWTIGVYIRSMPAADRQVYDEYLQSLIRQGELEGGTAPAS